MKRHYMTAKYEWWLNSGMIGSVSNLCTVFYSCWYSIVRIILVASPWLCQLEIVWFSVVLIPVICYLCPLWLEDHCNPVFKTWRTTQESIEEHNHFHRVVKGTGCLQLVCVKLFVDNSAFNPQERQFLWNVRWLLSTRVRKCNVFHED